jgi:hypothetical protein
VSGRKSRATWRCRRRPQGKAKAPSAAAWPRSLHDQALAVRAALVARPAPATAAELAASFKGAKVDRISELLTTLASLGQTRAVGDGRFAA